MTHSVNPVRRVLVVEDQPVVSDSLAVVLSNRGYAARAVYSGEHALEIARVFLPDLLISDVLLRGISGIEVADEVLSFLSDCKIILFAGQAATFDVLSRNHKDGRRRFEVLLKPIEPEALFALMTKLA